MKKLIFLWILILAYIFSSSGVSAVKINNSIPVVNFETTLTKTFDLTLSRIEKRNITDKKKLALYKGVLKQLKTNISREKNATKVKAYNQLLDTLNARIAEKERKNPIIISFMKRRESTPYPYGQSIG